MKENSKCEKPLSNAIGLDWLVLALSAPTDHGWGERGVLPLHRACHQGGPAVKLHGWAPRGLGTPTSSCHACRPIAPSGRRGGSWAVPRSCSRSRETLPTVACTGSQIHNRGQQGATGAGVENRMHYGPQSLIGSEATYHMYFHC